MLTLRHLRELKSLDKPQRHDALVASQDELVAAARDHDFVEFTNRVTVWLINHTDTDEVQEQVKKTSCTWDTNTDGSIDGRFHLDPLSAVAVGTALGDEIQRLFGQQSEGDGKADTINRPVRRSRHRMACFASPTRVCLPQIRVCRSAPGNTATPTTSGRRVWPPAKRRRNLTQS